MKFLFRTPLLPLFLVSLLIAESIGAQPPVLPVSDETGGGSNLQVRVVSSDGSSIVAGSRSTKGLAIQVTDPNGAAVPEAAVAFRLPDSGSSGTFADGSHSAVVYTDNAGKAHVDGIQWNETPGVAALRITVSKGNDHAGVLVEQVLASPPVNSVASATQPVRSSPLPPSPAILESSASPSGTVGVLAAAPSVSVESIGRKGATSANLLNAGVEPSVSIVSSPQERLSSGSKKKWIILGLVIAAGAGAGFAMAGKGGGSNSSSTAAPASSISFGSPTVSVGHP